MSELDRNSTNKDLPPLRFAKILSKPMLAIPIAVIGSVLAFFIIHIIIGETPGPVGLTISILIPLTVATPIILLLNVFVKHIERQKTLLEQANREIQQKSNDLEKLNNVKSTLFSIIAHDLRSPLASLKSVIDLIEKDVYDQRELKTVTNKLGVDVINTLDLLDNLLRWSKSQLSGITIKQEIFLLEDLAQKVIAHVQSTAKRKNIRIENQLSPEINVVGDTAVASLIIRNLVSNAIKFTPQGGQVTVSAKQKASEVEICVADTGIGIKDEDKAKLFKTESHFTTTGTLNEKGTGLGLILCKEFIEKLNGKIWVESTPNQGSRFYFTLPLSIAV